MMSSWSVKHSKKTTKAYPVKKEASCTPKQPFSRSHNGRHRSGGDRGVGGGSRGPVHSRPPRRRHAAPLASPPPPASTEEAIPIGLSFGAFEFQEFHTLGQRGGGVRELSQCLRSAQQKKRQQEEMLQTRDGIQQRREDLLRRATLRAVGEKVKDDPSKLSKALAKRRSRKRQSAKKWAKRLEALQHSVEHCVEEKENSKMYKGKKGKEKKGGKRKEGGAMKDKKRGNAGKRSNVWNSSGGKRAGGGGGHKK